MNDDIDAKGEDGGGYNVVSLEDIVSWLPEGMNEFSRLLADNKRKYDEQWEPYRGEYDRQMDLFRESLVSLKPDTVSYHIDNINAFLNGYCYREWIETVTEAADKIYWFLDDYDRRYRPEPYRVKRMSGSLKRFYRCLLDNSIVTTETYNRVLRTLKDQIDGFIEDAEKRVTSSFWDDDL